MPASRTKVILQVLAQGREEKVASSVMKVFGASSIAECLEIYDQVGAAERASLDEGVERMAAGAGAAFWLRVDAKS